MSLLALANSFWEGGVPRGLACALLGLSLNLCAPPWRPRGSPKTAPRGTKIVPRGSKIASRRAKMTIFVGNFDFAKNIEKPKENQGFWLPQPARNSLKMAPSPAKMAQDRSKMTPRSAQTTPRPPKIATRSPQDHPRPPQDRPRPLQDRSRPPQDRPRSLQELPRPLTPT